MLRETVGFSAASTTCGEAGIGDVLQSAVRFRCSKAQGGCEGCAGHKTQSKGLHGTSLFSSSILLIGQCELEGTINIKCRNLGNGSTSNVAEHPVPKAQQINIKYCNPGNGSAHNVAEHPMRKAQQIIIKHLNRGKGSRNEADHPMRKMRQVNLPLLQCSPPTEEERQPVEEATSRTRGILFHSPQGSGTHGNKNSKGCCRRPLASVQRLQPVERQGLEMAAYRRLPCAVQKPQVFNFKNRYRGKSFSSNATERPVLKMQKTSRKRRSLGRCSTCHRTERRIRQIEQVIKRMNQSKGLTRNKTKHLQHKIQQVAIRSWDYISAVAKMLMAMFWQILNIGCYVGWVCTSFVAEVFLVLILQAELHMTSTVKSRAIPRELFYARMLQPKAYERRQEERLAQSRRREAMLEERILQRMEEAYCQKLEAEISRATQRANSSKLPVQCSPQALPETVPAPAPSAKCPQTQDLDQLFRGELKYLLRDEMTADHWLELELESRRPLEEVFREDLAEETPMEIP
ncbi:hypothetical protein lerEdw1_003983 [Lerista edwardsae]|nr:hypothetical protein lerEdw1_003983 [Lerista edwardsae]